MPQLNAKVSPQQMAAIRKAANLEGRTVSNWLKWIIKDHVADKSVFNKS